MAPKFNLFWRDVIVNYAKIHEIPSTDPCEILAQGLSLNPEIKIIHKTIFYQRWVRMGIYFIRELLNDDGSFYTLQEYQDKYGLHSHFLEYNGLIYAIAQTWKDEIVDIQKLESITDKLVTLLNYCVKPYKPIYKLFSEKVFER